MSWLDKINKVNSLALFVGTGECNAHCAHCAGVPQDMWRDGLPTQRWTFLAGRLDMLAEDVLETGSGHRATARVDEEFRGRKDASALEPMITFGTNPGQGVAVTQAIPDPGSVADAVERETLKKALAYMGLTPGESLLGRPVDVVFMIATSPARYGCALPSTSTTRCRGLDESTLRRAVPI